MVGSPVLSAEITVTLTKVLIGEHRTPGYYLMEMSAMRILLRTLIVLAMLLVSRLDAATQQLPVRTQTEDYPEARRQT